MEEGRRRRRRRKRIDLSIRVEDSLGASLTFRSSEINEPLKRHLPSSDREEIKKTYGDHVGNQSARFIRFEIFTFSPPGGSFYILPSSSSLIIINNIHGQWKEFYDE